ncbi:MAG: hypothetical protein ACHQ4G_04965 [Opitutales bacterium]
MTHPRLCGPQCFLCVLLALGLGTGSVVASALEVTSDFTVSWDKNFSRTSATAYQKDLAVYDASLDVGWNRQLAPSWFLNLRGVVQVEDVSEYSAMNFVGAGPQFTLRRKFGLGAYAPVLEWTGGASGVTFREHGRSGTQAETGLRLAKRLSEDWRISVEGDWEQFSANQPPFDTHDHRVQADATWDVTERWQAGFGGARLWGQKTANAAWAVYGQALGGAFGPAVQQYYRAIPWEPSNTFGPGWVAYRVDCRVDMWWVSLGPALSANTSLPLRYESVHLVNAVGIRYNSEFWSLSLVHRF